MALSLETLLTPITVPEAQQFMIDVLKSLGFTGAASWQAGSFARTLGIEVPARVMSNIRDLIVAYGKGGYNDEASGDWLTLFSISHYDNYRVQAVKTQGWVELSASEDLPHTVGVGELVVADAIKNQTFRNLEEFTVTYADSPVPVLVEAELAGADGNADLNTVTIMQTTLAGVTVNNPGTDGVWITQVGANAEEDPELRTRNRTKWATRAYPTPEAGYENYTLEASEAITRVFVDGQNPHGPGSVHIWVAGVDGALPQSVADDVLAYIEGEPPPQGDGICRRPLGAILSCSPAVNRTVTVAGTVYIAAGYIDAEDNVEHALENLFESIPIGGTKTTGQGTVQFSSLYTAVMTVPGVINVVFTSPTGDVLLAPNEVAVPTLSLSFPVI